MDIRLQRPQPVCSRTGRVFTAGEEFVSVLMRHDGALGRIDVAPEAWDGPPCGTIAWWRSRYPAATDTGPSLAPVDVLLDALESLEGDPTGGPLRYVLALQLLRRRVLKMHDHRRDAGGDDSLALSCRRRDREYCVRVVTGTEATDPEVVARLEALLWSGDAA